jgi:hypothetical protein
MWTAETVLVCALALLGRPAHTLPPIQLVDQRPADVSARAEGFVRDGDPRIQLLTSTAVFVEARRATSKCGQLQALRRIASVIAHEEWHVRHPGDEVGAYRAQLMALAAMGAGVGNVLHADVLRSMRSATGGTALPTRAAASPPPSPRPPSAADPRAMADATSSSHRRQSPAD